jgi:hypothetical protein
LAKYEIQKHTVIKEIGKGLGRGVEKGPGDLVVEFGQILHLNAGNFNPSVNLRSCPQFSA